MIPFAPGQMMAFGAICIVLVALFGGGILAALGTLGILCLAGGFLWWMVDVAGPGHDDD